MWYQSKYCLISRSFADHSSKILISKVDKFYTGITMIMQKNSHVRTSSQNLIHRGISYAPKSIQNIMECKRDSFSGALGRASETN